MMEYAFIIATLAAGGGWLMYLDKARKASYWKEEALFERALTSHYSSKAKDGQATIDRQADTIGGLQGRMQRIADQETPSANATVKRMAAIARGEA